MCHRTYFYGLSVRPSCHRRPQCHTDRRPSLRAAPTSRKFTVGIDVSKSWLDVKFLPTGKPCRWVPHAMAFASSSTGSSGTISPSRDRGHWLMASLPPSQPACFRGPRYPWQCVQYGVSAATHAFLKRHLGHSCGRRSVSRMFGKVAKACGISPRPIGSIARVLAHARVVRARSGGDGGIVRTRPLEREILRCIQADERLARDYEILNLDHRRRPVGPIHRGQWSCRIHQFRG